MLRRVFALVAIGVLSLAVGSASAFERRAVDPDAPSERRILTVAPPIVPGATYQFETTIRQVRSDRLREEIRKIHKVERLDVLSPMPRGFRAEFATVAYRMSDTDPFLQRLHHTFALDLRDRIVDLELAPDGFVAAARDWRPAVHEAYAPALSHLRRRMPARLTREVARPYAELLEMSDQTAGQTLADTMALWTGAFGLGLTFGESVHGRMVGLSKEDEGLIYDVSATFSAIEDGLARLDEHWRLDHEQLERQEKARIARAKVSDQERARMLGGMPQDMAVTIQRTSWVDLHSGTPLRVEIKKHVRKGALGNIREHRVIEARRLDAVYASN